MKKKNQRTKAEAMQLLDSAEPPFLLIAVVLFTNKITAF